MNTDKTKRKSLGQVAFESGRNGDRKWSELHALERANFERHSIAVAREALRRARKLNMHASNLFLSHVK